MSLKLVVLQGHPDPAGGHLCHALAQAYEEGARENGAQTSVIDIARLDFPILRDPKDFYAGKAATPEALRPAQQAIIEADHVFIIYPLWMGSMPALLKAFLEQAFRPGVALDESAEGWPKPMLKGKSARVVVTMGMPAAAYRWWFGAHSLKSFERNILKFAGMNPVRDTLVGMTETMKPATFKTWRARMHSLGRALD